jgi:hypothetical protein
MYKIWKGSQEEPDGTPSSSSISRVEQNMFFDDIILHAERKAAIGSSIPETD